MLDILPGAVPIVLKGPNWDQRSKLREPEATDPAGVRARIFIWDPKLSAMPSVTSFVRGEGSHLDASNVMTSS